MAESSLNRSVLKGKDMKQPLSSNLADTTTEFCPIHSDKPIVYYCKDHEELLCTDCKVTVHRACTGNIKITDFCQQKEFEEHIESIKKDIDTNMGRLQNMLQQRRAGQQNLELQEKKCHTQVRDIRDKIKTLLDKLEDEIDENIVSTFKPERMKVENHITSLNIVVKDLEQGKQSIETTKSLRDSGSFINMQRLRLKKKMEVVYDIQPEIEDVTVELKPDRILTDVLGNLEQLFEVNVERTTIYQSGRIDPDIVLGRPYRTHKYDIRCDEDKEACGIRGCLILADDNILLSDYENQSLKLFNKSWKKQSYIKLQDKPCDVSSVSDKQVIVSLPEAKKLQFVEIGEKLKLGHQISVDKTCWGVDYHRDKLYVSCYNEDNQGEIQVISKTGECLKCIGGTNETNKLHLPQYITVDTEDRIIVSEKGTNKLTWMKKTGEHVYSYADTDMEAPAGLLLDRKDNVYVCGYDSNTVQVINEAGQKIKNLLGKEDRLHKPCTVAYRASDKSLVVGMNADKILVFQYQ